MKKTSPVRMDVTDKGFCWFFGIMVLLAFLPPFTNAVIGVLGLLPFIVMLVMASGWLLGTPGFLVSLALSLFFEIALFFYSIKF